MHEYIAEPYDVLYFRGNKSFHFGEWYSEGVFPPLPSTFQGFVRTKMLDDMGWLDSSGIVTKPSGDIAKEVGNDESLPFEITGPFLGNDNDIYFSNPRDLFRATQAGHTTICQSVLNSLHNDTESDLDFTFSCAQMPDGKLDKILPPAFISLNELVQYREKMEFCISTKEELLFTEDRVGIGLDKEKKGLKNRQVQTSRFYVTPYNRLGDGVGLYFNINIKALMGGTSKLGSESHLVFARKIRGGANSLLEEKLSPQRAQLNESIFKTRTFRLLLLQPGVFGSGWMPFAFDTTSRKVIATEPKTRMQLELLSACIGEPFTVSGYSYQSNKETKKQEGVKLKPAVRAVPAGSVYLFKIVGSASDADVQELIAVLDNKKIDNQQFSNMGFNHTIVACGQDIQL